MSVGKDKGLAKLKNRKLIYGIGVNDFKISTIGENGRGIPEYVMWKSMFTRCYCEKYHPQKAIRFSAKKYIDQGWMKNVPLYAVCTL